MNVVEASIPEQDLIGNMQGAVISISLQLNF